jgi:DNA polymerase I-like protein with 3'-5' exonuclease and polymerase domains
MLCQPPDNDLGKLLEKVRKENREIEKKNAERAKEHLPPLPLTPTPMECCSPRFWNEVKPFTDVFAVGGSATRMMVGSGASVMQLRGSPTEVERMGKKFRVMPTLHPSFVSRARRWMHVLKNDVMRGVRWFRGELGWKAPTILWHPRAKELREFLFAPGIPYWTYDVETDGIESLTANLRCIGIGTPASTVLVGIASIQGGMPFYSERELAEVYEVLRDFFTDPNILKCGHNAGVYDRLVMEHHLGITPTPLMDTILLHRLVESELPHSLGFVGSMYTEAPAWKCYDGATEVLTPHGWVRFDALEKGVPVAEWDKGVVRFVEPRAYHDQHHVGTAWRLTDQATDLLVTPDHKMVYRQKGSERLVTCMVQDLPATGSIPHMGTMHGDVWFHPDFLRLLVATQADGSWTHTSRGIGIDFGFTKKRKVERLLGLLRTLHVPFSASVGAYERIRVSPSAWTERLHTLLGDAKVFPASLLDLMADLRAVFLDELPLWDGTKGADHTNYNTTVEANANIVQAIAVTSGRAARKYVYPNGEHLPVFRVSLPSGKVRSRAWSKLEGLEREEVPYDGRIYCVSVPAGFLLVRRNGKVTVAANTDREGRKLAFGSETDEELHIYCCYDVAITAAVVAPLYEQVRLREQLPLLTCDHDVQKVCAEMHDVGMFVDQPTRKDWETKLIDTVIKHRDGLRETVGLEKINPGSPFHLRDLLFEKWRLEPPIDDEYRFTTSGDASTSDDVLRACLTIKNLTPTQRKAIEHIRYYRKAQKLLGTYVVKLRYNTDLAEEGFDADEDQDDQMTRLGKGEPKKGIVDPRTGRMHPGYNPHVTTSGRLSSSKPINAQNFPSKLRGMVTAAPGHILVGADADQLELRIAASRWESVLYLEALNENADPHASTALSVFGAMFQEADGFPGGVWKGSLFIPSGEGKWGGKAKKLRDLAKRVQYAGQYGASVETVHRVISQTETDNGDGTTSLPYLDITLREVRMMHEKWLKGAKFDAGWEREMATYRNLGYLTEPVMGRRRDFLDGENLNEIVNFPIQASGASLMNIALLDIWKAVPLRKWGPGTGIINQCHDSIVVECPLDGCVYDPDKKKWVAAPGSIPHQVKQIIEGAMNQTHKGIPNVRFTATAEISTKWNEV